MIHAANAIQKNTSDTIVSQCQPVSTAVAYVADEYSPSGNTAAHARSRRPAARSRRPALRHHRGQREPTLQRHTRQHPEHDAVFGKPRPHHRARRYVGAQPERRIEVGELP
jgi:hypothetical protein